MQTELPKVRIKRFDTSTNSVKTLVEGREVTVAFSNGSRVPSMDEIVRMARNEYFALQLAEFQKERGVL